MFVYCRLRLCFNGTVPALCWNFSIDIELSVVHLEDVQD